MNSMIKTLLAVATLVVFSTSVSLRDAQADAFEATTVFDYSSEKFYPTLDYSDAAFDEVIRVDDTSVANNSIVRADSRDNYIVQPEFQASIVAPLYDDSRAFGYFGAEPSEFDLVVEDGVDYNLGLPLKENVLNSPIMVFAVDPEKKEVKLVDPKDIDEFEEGLILVKNRDAFMGPLLPEEEDAYELVKDFQERTQNAFRNISFRSNVETEAGHCMNGCDEIKTFTPYTSTLGDSKVTAEYVSDIGGGQFIVGVDQNIIAGLDRLIDSKFSDDFISEFLFDEFLELARDEVEDADRDQIAFEQNQRMLHGINDYQVRLPSRFRSVDSNYTDLALRASWSQRGFMGMNRGTTFNVSARAGQYEVLLPRGMFTPGSNISLDNSKGYGFTLRTSVRY